MTGPGALNVSFDASIGTSADQLALLLASGLNLAGYNPQVSGGIVKFFPPIPGMVSFLAEGDGLEYAIAAAVPEPSTLAIGTGLPIILVYAWCRRRRTPVDI